MALTLATTIFVTSLVQLVLFLKLLFVFFGAANAKVNGGERAPEDTYQKQCAEGQEASAGWVAKKALVDRFFRMTINDLENVVPGLIIMWSDIFMISGSTEGHLWVHLIAIIVFTLGRIFHTFFYAKGISKARTISYVFGLFSLLTLLVNGVIASAGNL